MLYINFKLLNKIFIFSIIINTYFCIFVKNKIKN